MSFAGVNPSATTPGIYRLVSGAPTAIHINASNNSNLTFNTNISSLDFAIRIWRVRWQVAFSANGGLVSADSASLDVQLLGQLTENQTKTVILTTDTSYLDKVDTHLVTSEVKDTAAGFVQAFPAYPMEVIHDFNPVTTPWTVATKLNLVASSISINAGDATTTWAPNVAIEYTLERLTADLRDYLAKRLQIQGS